jgi:tRNA modification GTPase
MSRRSELSTTDTIVAVATPPGRGGIGVVRISGGDARSIAGRLLAHRGPLEPRRATFTRIRAAANGGADPPESIDQVVATSFPAPHSYTGDDVVEVSAHGSPVVLRAIVSAALDCGARLAEPGEFTLRAFLNGRIDLMQAEAVGDLVDAVTPLQARVAFDQLEGTLTRRIAALEALLFDLVARLEASVDFPDEGYHFIESGEVASAIDRLIAETEALLADATRGRLIREGLQVAIVGKPNVGKSSLFNALVGTPRAIVAETPGTTRDLVTETIDLDGIRLTLIDTAGRRASVDAVEAEGVERSKLAEDVADLVVLVVDNDEWDDEAVGGERIVVRNKIDAQPPRRATDAICVSARTGEGMDDLRRAIARVLTGGDAAALRERPAITNVRHARLVSQARDALVRARDAAAGVNGSMPEEFVLSDLQDARGALEEIAGRRAPDDLLAHIFARFCVGK